jgi:2-polyprenyl-3-methyl-5-hydroxy-6-metoxy-1,4-benzoquinol methylase
MTTPTQHTPARGKPADYGQELVKRRFRLTSSLVDLRNKTVLDFGCGNGAQTIEFLGSGCRITGVDIDQQDLDVLKEYLQSNNLDSIVAVRYDGSTLPLESSSFDVILSYEVIEHVQNESQTLEELSRVLKPGGEMVISVPNKGWVFETHGANLPLLPWNRVPFFSWLPHSIHSRFAKARIYKKNEIIRLLADHRFDILTTMYITAPMDVVKAPWLKNLLRSTVFTGDTTTVSMLSTSILIHCRKN